MSRRERWTRLGGGVGALAAVATLLAWSAPLAGQDSTQMALEVAVHAPSRDPQIATRHLLEDTPWLSALREGLPVRLQYRLEVWRSRDGWLDELQRIVEWTLVVRHEPVLDQFSVTRFGPGNFSQTRRYGTAGALAGALGVPFRFQIAPRDAGQFYYAASLNVTTLSDSDLEKFERLLRGEIAGESGGGSLVDRARRLALRLAGLPTQRLDGRSEMFEVR